MSPSSPLLPMSQIIAADAPLLSPVQSPTVADAHWDFQFPGSFSYPEAEPYYPDAIIHSPSPMRRHSSAELESECLPTTQLFDASAGSGWLTPPESLSARSSPTIDTLSIKREYSPPLYGEEDEHGMLGNKPCQPATKKSRSAVPPVKDYVPPDVSGLSKREARLVKNRAAAFLSRQRKREEFELMEIRVGELEEEGAQLKRERSKMQSEIDSLRQQLAIAIAAKSPSTPSETLISPSINCPTPSETSSSVSSKSVNDDNAVRPTPPRKSLALVVLLCALPALLALPHTQSTSSNYRPSNTYRHGRFSSLSGLSSLALPAPVSFLDMMDMDPMHMDVDTLLPLPQLPLVTPKEPTEPTTVSVSVAGGLDLALSFGQDEEEEQYFDAISPDQPHPSGPMKIHIQPAKTSSSPSSMILSQDSDPLGPFLTPPLDASLASPRQHGQDLDFSDSMTSMPTMIPPLPNQASRQRRVRITPVPTADAEGGFEWSVEVDA